MRVVIAEDSVLLREGLERLLNENRLEVVGSCQTGAELLPKVRSFAPDVAKNMAKQNAPIRAKPETVEILRFAGTFSTGKYPRPKPFGGMASPLTRTDFRKPWKVLTISAVSASSTRRSR